ncbi:MAG: hypothetical protein RI936_16 [Pseudomonadota bacterium]
MTYSGDLADADAAERAMRAPAMPPLTLTGEQRRYAVERLEAIAEALTRAVADTKAAQARRRYEANLDSAETLLRMLKGVS